MECWSFHSTWRSPRCPILDAATSARSTRGVRCCLGNHGLSRGFSFWAPADAILTPAEERCSRALFCAWRVTLRSDPEPFLQLPRHPPAHLQRRLAAAQTHEVLALGGALDALEKFNPNQGIAVDAHERGAEFPLEQAQ